MFGMAEGIRIMAKQPASAGMPSHTATRALMPRDAEAAVRAVVKEQQSTEGASELLESDFAEAETALQKLRVPFGEDGVEKLPRPMWKGAWDGESKGRCSECGGYHVLSNCIHLDYAGHALVTDRLLEVDLFWSWEPVAWDEDGLPKMDRYGGMWIKLTVCGVTRLGYGDAVGKSASTTAIKEVIGDAIRNAAMRFGVGLDLWAKISLHEERNPGDGETPQSQRRPDRGGAGEGRRPDRGDDGGDSAVASDRPRAANQDALDSLGAVCDEHGYDRRTMAGMYFEWADQRRSNTDLLTADADNIMAFAAKLIEDATPEADSGADGGAEGGEMAESAADEARADAESADSTGDPGPGDEAGDIPVGAVDPAAVPGGIDTSDNAAPGLGDVDTSDVEKKPGEMF